MSNPYLTEKRLSSAQHGKLRIGKEPLDVYLYSIRSGLLEKRFGTLYKSASGHGRFAYFDQDKLSYKYVVVSQVSHLVYNDMLWLPEDNDEEAKRIFIQHENSKYEEEKTQLEKHQQKLILLRTTKWWKKV